MKGSMFIRDAGAVLFTGAVAGATFIMLVMAQAKAENLPDNVPFQVKSRAAYSGSVQTPGDYAPSAYAPANSGDFVPSSMPQVLTQNGVNFITGGIGDEERSAMEAVKPQYNLAVMSAAMDGAFAGEAQVSITNRAGDEVLNVMSGPLLYAQLPAGSYKLTATNPNRGDQVRTQNFTTGSGKHANVHLSWK